CLGGMDYSILDMYGGEFEWDRYTVKLHKRRGADRGFTIRYGKNLVDMTQEENIAQVYTGVFPYWSDNDGNTVTLPEGAVKAEAPMTMTISWSWTAPPNGLNSPPNSSSGNTPKPTSRKTMWASPKWALPY